MGVLSDTHGHLYPEVKDALAGVDHIVHAGDIGSPWVLGDLRKIAPVTAVRGNTDLDAWSQALPAVATVDLAGVKVVVRHQLDPNEWRVAPGSGSSTADSPAGHTIVVTGHSHIASIEQRGRVLFLNPGSAGPQRFGRPRTLALVEIRDGLPSAEIVVLAG